MIVDISGSFSGSNLRGIPGVTCAVDSLVDPARLLAIAKAATGEQWDSNGTKKYAELTALFSSRDVFVASFGVAAQSASGKAKNDSAQVGYPVHSSRC